MPTPRGGSVTVKVPAGADDAEVAQLTREAILLSEARRAGWAQTDPVIFERLVANMRFVAPEEARRDAVDLYDEAVKLGMLDSDVVVRKRLLERATQVLGSVPDAQRPTDAQMQAYLDAHAKDFELPARVRFGQVFLSADQRSGSLDRDAEAMAAQLAKTDPAPAAAFRLGDPLLSRRPIALRTTRELDDTYGPGFGDQVAAAPVGRWVGPLRSTFGMHFVKVLEQIRARPPRLEEVRDQVRAEMVREVSRRLANERFEALRRHYELRVVRTGARAER